jgi:hypothetical protein
MAKSECAKCGCPCACKGRKAPRRKVKARGGRRVAPNQPLVNVFPQMALVPSGSVGVTSRHYPREELAIATERVIRAAPAAAAAPRPAMRDAAVEARAPLVDRVAQVAAAAAAGETARRARGEREQAILAEREAAAARAAVAVATERSRTVPVGVARTPMTLQQIAGEAARGRTITLRSSRYGGGGGGAAGGAPAEDDE